MSTITLLLSEAVLVLSAAVLVLERLKGARKAKPGMVDIHSALPITRGKVNFEYRFAEYRCAEYEYRFAE